VRDILRTRTRDEWLARFADADVCLTPVYRREEVAADAHVAAREAGQVSPRISAPALGADTDDVLEAAGVVADERRRLRAAKVI
jgi:crotonobetainyl-CoA:carnitine CoA-transferase CaiB-like acyl-CoA transferase